MLEGADEVRLAFDGHAFERNIEDEMRAILVLLVLAGLTYAGIKYKAQKPQEEPQAAQQPAVAADKRVPVPNPEAQRQMVSQGCLGAERNRGMLHKVMQSGGSVVSLNNIDQPLTQEQMKAAFEEAQQYIERNCAEAVKAWRTMCDRPPTSEWYVCRST
jgi:hypothetical protein